MSIPNISPIGGLRRLLAGALLVFGTSLLPEPSVAANSAVTLEYGVKAGYLFNFAKYITWPSSAFPAETSPFVVGVLDDGEASAVVRSAIEGKNVNGRPVEVRSVSTESIGVGVHILLVTRAADKSPEELRKLAGSASVLMVGETDEFAERGGAIGFVHENESIRLTLCLEHATDRGLKVSAKLATVAKPV